MHITVRLFALLREKVGTDTVYLQIPEHARVAEALEVLQEQHAVLQPYLARVRLSLQMQFVDTAAILHEGDELAIIPPVSGGN
jgi:molybdopterin converting factor subunit 1